MRFLLTFGPGVLASSEDQAPGWHLALPLSSRPAVTYPGTSDHFFC